MTIDPEVIPPSSSAGKNAVRFFPKWILYVSIALGAFIFLGLIKILFPLILISIVLGFIWKQVANY